MIRVERLSKSYGQVEALRSISFHVPAGQVCGYLGPNGAGKTTTVRILTGVLQQTSGDAFVAGHRVAEEPLEVKRRIGYVSETGAVYSTLSVNEYLALVGALHHMEPEDVADRTQQMLGLFGIDDAADRRLDTLSKGMRQKVVISAALLHNPEVLLLDEPLSGLDANAAMIVKDIVRGLADRGKAVLYCSHMLDVVERLCERVIILNRGEILADGPTAELVGSVRQGTLETVFHSLTSGDDHQQRARAVLDVVQQQSVQEAERPVLLDNRDEDRPPRRRKRRKRRRR